MKYHLYQAVIWLYCSLANAITLPSSYNVVWDTQSRNSSESMPLGGHDLGLNVWVENSTILFYIAKSGAYDENNSLVKLGRIRLTLTPNPFSQKFSQSLVLNDGYVLITGENDVAVKLWVDVYNPVVHADITAGMPVSLVMSYESWRYQDRPMTYITPVVEQDQSSYDNLPGVNATTKADNISFSNGGVLMTHRNTPTTIFDYTVPLEGLGSYVDTMYNPIANNTYGIWMYSPELQPSNVTSGFYVNTTYKAWNLASGVPKTSYSIAMAIYQNQTSSMSAWESSFNTVVQSMNDTQDDTIAWWHNFWDRSYIVINENAGPTDAGFVTGKNYQIFRYMQGCNAQSDWPMRFNGGLFTFDPVFVNSEAPYTPDFRRWTGGVFTAQNQRLVYWPLLKSGDFDLMMSEFEFYRRITSNAKLRGRYYFGINATVFTEQIESFGLPNIFEYHTTGRPSSSYPLSPGSEFPLGIEFNDWLEWLQDTANEFVDMILQANMYSGLDVTPYLDFIESQLQWFDIFYQRFHATVDTYPRVASPLDTSSSSGNGNGPLIIYPGAGCETYKSAYNPASTISGLKKVLSDLLQVSPAYISGNTSYYEGYLARVPAVQWRLQQDHLCISPAQAYSRIQNVEIPQLYPVFPWGEYGLGCPNLTIAIDTYLYDTETQAFHDNVGWKQDVIWMARMGLTNNATNLTISRWADSEVFRFPVFKGPNFDWAPDINHYGVASIALQEMLLQTYAKNNTELRLLGAWPEDWSVSFKLYAPFNTTVEANVTAGQVTSMMLTPSSRESDVVYGQS